MEVELDVLKNSVMALLTAANCSAEGDTYRALSDAVLQVRHQPHHDVPCWPILVASSMSQ